MPVNMAKMFKLPKLDLDLKSPIVTKEQKHWVKMLNNFFEEFGETTPNKLRMLVCCVSFRVNKYIEDCTTYESAINTLEQQYIKTPNKIFTRHLYQLRDTRKISR